MTQTAYEGWALLELLGHRQRVGKVSEAEIYGGKLIKIDIPVKELDGEYVTEYYGCASIYALRPISEDIAQSYITRLGDPRPIRPADYQPKFQDAIEYEDSGDDIPY